MSDETVPKTLEIPLAGLISLGVEHWRLTTWLTGAADAPNAATARHALRRIEDFLKRSELTVIAMEGRPFDPGLAVKVVDVVEDPGLPKGKIDIDETISPMVLWRDRVVKAAEVVTRRGIGK